MSEYNTGDIERAELPYEDRQDAWKIIPELRAEVERLREERDLLKSALENLVNRLDMVHGDPRYFAVWQLHQIRCGPYSGPQYEKEFHAAKVALNSFSKKGISA